MNHFLNNQNSNYFLPKRLIFEVEKGSEAAKQLTDEEKVAKLMETAVSESRKMAKSAAIDSGKQAAVADKKPEAAKAKLPEIPKVLTGLKVDNQKAKITNGNVEQPFTFGDLNIMGKVTFPEKPEANAKTTYLFNYVDDPSKFDQAKFIEELKKHKQDLGNTVIVTLKTPQGETKVDRQKVDTIATLTANLERFQEDLSKNPKFKDIKLARPETILHMTTKENAKRVTEALEKYHQNLATDPRAVNALKLLDGDPEKFSSSLDKFLKVQNTPVVVEPTVQSDIKPVQPGGKSPVGHGGGGKHKGGGAGESSGGKSPVGHSGGGSSGGESSERVSDADAPASPEQAGASKESKEGSPEGIDQLLAFGDSLMEGAIGKIRANKVERHSKVGKTLSTILAEIRNFDQSGYLEKYRNQSLLIDGGTNDLGGNPTQKSILDNYKEIWAIAKKYNIKVFNCTIPPFGQSTYPTLTEKFEEKNAIRIWVNQQIEQMAGQEAGPYKVIALHKKVSEGGLADDNNSDVLAFSYKAPDGVHLNPEGYAAMAKAIQGIMGEPADPNQKPESSAVAGAKYETGGMRPAKYSPELGEFTSKVNQEFIASGAAYGTKKTVKFQGKTYTAIFTEHNKQEATGKYGKFQATEIWETVDEAEKKSLN